MSYYYVIGVRMDNRTSNASQFQKVLTENLNRKVLRKDILLRVWNDDSYFNSRNLDVYITRLRDYFKADRGVEIITLKGVGYLFKVDS